MIDELLAECGAVKKDISLTAFGAGPGSFTGLRVACGVAQGIAWALKTDVAAVCNLEADALAAAEVANLAPGTRLAVMNDARMQEAYSALYEVVEGPRGVQEVLPPQLVKPAGRTRLALEAARADALCGSAAGVYAEAFNLPEAFPVCGIPDDMVMRIARLGLADEAQGRTMMPALASPLYVRDRVALTMRSARGESACDGRAALPILEAGRRGGACALEAQVGADALDGARLCRRAPKRLVLRRA